MTEQPPGPPPESYPPPPAGGYPPPPPSSGGAYLPPQGQFAAPATGTNGLAIGSLVCSVLGLVCGIGPIVGIVLGIIALNQIKQTGQAGRGLALAGIIVGAAMLAIVVIWLIVYVATMGASSYS